MTSGISMPTSTPIPKTTAYRTARKGADNRPKMRNSAAAETPPSSPTSSSMSMKRARTSASFT
jgi:hypothetical protein